MPASRSAHDPCEPACPAPHACARLHACRRLWHELTPCLAWLRETSTFLTLPQDVWLKIAEHLEPGERANLAATARNFRYAMDHGLLSFDAGDFCGENSEEKIACARSFARYGSPGYVGLFYVTHYCSLLASHVTHHCFWQGPLLLPATQNDCQCFSLHRMPLLRDETPVLKA